ncbi:MAG: tripartite tricarboxylate transporter substrate binding protein, partial [Staphylothermus sp.]|nr:tripartite tricarboxylate transporter substrate binding protein [Staphylothermus sp.]
MSGYPALTKTTALVIVLIVIIAAVGVGYYLYTQTAEEKYPSKPITIYVPWSPGGGTDRTTRTIASLLQEKFGVEINVLNKVGGGGAATFKAGAEAQPDGYTLTAITIELNIFPWIGTLDITYEDFEPIAMLICNPAVIVVKADAPWQTVDDLVQYIKEHPGELKASGTAQAGVWDIARIAFLKAIGASPDDVVWVPSQGAAPALQELISGGIDIAFVGSGEAKPLYDSGEVRILAVMSDERVEGLEDVPTLKELGYDVAICGWAGLAAPKGTPKERVQILVDAVREAYYSDTFQQFLKDNSFVGKLILGEDFKNYLA